MGGDWGEDRRDHKIRRTAPLVDEHERPSAGPAQPNRKKDRPWQIEYRTHPDQVARRKRNGWWSRFWDDLNRWTIYTSYKTENSRDTALGNLQRKNQAYWQYRKKDPT